MASILKLRGTSALSDARLNRLAADCRSAVGKVRELRATQYFFVEFSTAPVAEELARLMALLAAEPSAGPTADLLLVTPRLGTISPWSSKATDIARNCGLTSVLRIERGVLYEIELSRGLLGAATLDAGGEAA
jgi:phosphoribosylformylglycinamidine synthase